MYPETKVHPDSEFGLQMAILNQEFAALLPRRLDEIERLWGSVSEGDRSRDNLRSLTRQVHSLTGSAATFGYPEMSRAGTALEKCLRSSFTRDTEPDAEVVARAAALVETLCRSGHSPAATEPFTAIQVTSEHADQRLVYVVEDEASTAVDLSRQLASFGYCPRVFLDTQGVAAAIAERRPDALILDIGLPEGDLGGVELLQELRDEVVEQEIPVLFISVRSDIEARLATLRSGGEAFFVKPLDTMAVIDRLNQLTRKQRADPFRVLIVDDDKTLADRYALVLRRGGMVVSVLDRPKEILDRLTEERPDLVLMDINMPDCSGLELVKVIRQIDRFVSLPIVYLSTEADVENQMLALRHGGDDFLTKPLTDQHLLAAVSVRAERSRVLRALMTRDSLTGLLTHVPFKERLETELARCERGGGVLALAMLDLDRFKQVNDRYGHLAGDKALRSLAQLLDNRVRGTDSVGRYGGEEFGIILSDCELDDAVGLMDELRESFAGVRFRCADADFKLSFSAGVAASRPGITVDELVHEADSALYQAKAAGRSRVVRFQA